MNDIDTVGGSIGLRRQAAYRRDGVAGKGVGHRALGEARQWAMMSAGLGFLRAARALDAAEGEDLGQPALPRSACRRRQAP